MAEDQSSRGNILFRIFWWFVQHINPEWSHSLMYMGLRDGAFPKQSVKDPVLAVDVWGHIFQSPIGIAAGVDKKGNVLDSLISMGYSFGEFGPYTLEKEMPDKKSLYLTKEKAILTQCRGYRNPGIMCILPWFVKRRYLPHYVGVNIAIPTDSEEANIKLGRHFTYQEEFVLMSQKLAPYCDYITLDFSHPNSELGTMIVDGATITPIVSAVKEAVRLAAPIQTPPILVKVPLDINLREVPLVVKSLLEAQADGVVIAGPLSVDKNSTLVSEQILTKFPLSTLTGKPLKEKILELVRQFYRESQGKLSIISCGGVYTAEDAFQQICAGASLIQLDTSVLAYEGPTVLFDIHKGLVKLLVQRGFTNVNHAVGCDFKMSSEPVAPVQPAPEPAAAEQTSAEPTQSTQP